MLKCIQSIKILKKLISTVNLIILTTFMLSACSLFQTQKYFIDESAVFTDFKKGQALISSQDYAESVPFLIKSLEQKDENYAETLFLLSRSYDQLSQPDLVINTINEYQNLKSNNSLDRELIVQFLNIKNEIKLGTSQPNSKSKTAIQKIINHKNFSKKNITEALIWPLDFKCDQFCVKEILFLQNVQIYLLYVVELNNEDSKKAAALLQLKYSFFYNILKSNNKIDDQKNEIKVALLKSLNYFNKIILVATFDLKNNYFKTMQNSLSDLEKELQGGKIESQ